MSKHFKKYHKEDTSHATKKEARRNAELALKRADGFMLFTVEGDGAGGLKYGANAFIDKDHTMGMPAFIQQVLTQRQPDLQGGDDGEKDGSRTL